MAYLYDDDRHIAGGFYWEIVGFDAAELATHQLHFMLPVGGLASSLQVEQFGPYDLGGKINFLLGGLESSMVLLREGAPLRDFENPTYGAWIKQDAAVPDDFITEDDL